MPDPPELLDDLEDFLVGEGVVCRFADARTADEPPLILDPRDGVPAPTGLSVDVAVAVFLDNGPASKPYESGWRWDKLDFVFYATRPQHTWALHDRLRPLLIDRDAWQMGNRRIHDTRELRSLRRRGSNSDGFSHDWAVLVQTSA
jgi:hypothetical protein